MSGEKFRDCEPCFVISVVSKAVNMHPQTIRHYENLGFIKPYRTKGNVRLYSKKDIEILEKISSYTNMGVNLAGVEIIMKLLEQMDSLGKEMDIQAGKMEEEMEELKKKFLE